MPTGRPHLFELTLSETERAHVATLAASRTLPYSHAWLNQVERWFGHITQRAIRRGSFRTVRELVRRIDAFVQHYKAGARPFVWTATPDAILAKLQRLLQVICGTRH